MDAPHDLEVIIPQYRLIRKKIWPTDTEKVRKNTKEKRVGRGFQDRESIKGGDSYLASL